MQVKGELRGDLVWNGDIIKPWYHDCRVAIAVKRLSRRAVNGFVIVVIRDTGRAKGDHHIGPHRCHSPKDVLGERLEVGSDELLIAVVQEDWPVGPRRL